MPNNMGHNAHRFYPLYKLITFSLSLQLHQETSNCQTKHFFQISITKNNPKLSLFTSWFLFQWMSTYLKSMSTAGEWRKKLQLLPERIWGSAFVHAIDWKREKAFLRYQNLGRRMSFGSPAVVFMRVVFSNASRRNNQSVRV